MCGIAGFTTRNWNPGRERIQSATDTLIHRGPDQQGVFRSPICSLGATRLKIVDLAHGDQPIYSEDRDSVIVFNGEIYNHLEVRRELESLGHHFQTHCDTETVLQAFLEWDTDCFARLRGMFAAAIWSNSRQRLVIARDRVGIKPLYIAERGEDLLFASELKGILVHPEVERRLSLNGLDCYLSMNYVPSPWTLVDGIEKLSPGHWLEWQDGRTRKEAYWKIPEVKQVNGPTPKTLDEAKSELDFLLDQSIREHLMADVPLSVWLSGGVDSSTVLHYAAKASSSRLRTFSISFNGHSFDESGYIREVVRHYDTEHEQLDLNPTQDLEGAIQELSYYSDEPSADSGALPVWFLSKLTKPRCTVALSGEGGDEIFAGYLTYRANTIAAQVKGLLPPAAIRLALRALRLWPASNEKISMEYKVKRLLQGCLMRPERAHIYWNGTFSDAEKKALLRAPLPAALADVLGRLAASVPGDGVSPYLEFDQEYYLADDILVKSDRMSMAHAVEVRPPFLDHRIIEFAATLPSELKIRGGRQKFVLRELMGSKLPPVVLRHQKLGFDIPAHEWFRGPLRSILLETLDEAEVEHSDLFQFAEIRRYTQLHLDRKINVGYHLWGLLMLFLWMKRWKIQSSPSQLSKTEKPGEANARGRTMTVRRSYLIVLLFASAVYLGCVFSPPSLQDDVDSVLAQASRNMVTSGDWVTPRLDGVPYLEKPPLQYWPMAVSFSIFGAHDWAARIPIALSVIALCLVTTAFGIWAFDNGVGLLAGLCMATCIGLWLFTRIVLPDALQTLTITMALWAFLRLLDDDERHPRAWAAIFAASLGVGLLIKSLIGVVFPIGAVIVYLALTRQLFSVWIWKRLRPLSGTLIILLIAVPWHLLAAIRNPPFWEFTMKSIPGEYHGFLWFFFINEQLLRFLNLRYPRDYDTVPPVLFWLFNLAWLFPWSAYLAGIFRLSYKPIDRAGKARLLALCWIGFVMVFFTFSTTQEYYSMPIYPAMALLIGSAMVLEGKTARIGTRVLTVIFAVAAVVAVAILIAVRHVPTPGDISQALTSNPAAYKLSLGHMEDLTLKSFAYLRLPLAVAAIAFLIGAIGTSRTRARGEYVAIALAMVVFFHAARLALVRFDPFLSSRPLVKVLEQSPPGTLIIDHHYYWFSSVFFYTNQSALLLNGRFNNMVYGSYAPNAADVFLTDSQFLELWHKPERYYVFSSERSVDRLRSVSGADQLIPVEAIGGKSLFTNHPIPTGHGFRSRARESGYFGSVS